MRPFFGTLSSTEWLLVDTWLDKGEDDADVVCEFCDVLNENSLICPKWFRDGETTKGIAFRSLDLAPGAIPPHIELIGLIWLLGLPMTVEDNSLDWKVLLFLILKNFLAFSSSSQLLAGDQIMDGFDGTEAMKDVGVQGLMS